MIGVKYSRFNNCLVVKLDFNRARQLQRIMDAIAKGEIVLSYGDQLLIAELAKLPAPPEEPEI